ncbi:MAG: hypothetical protein Q8880_01545 [Bacteroidota bacterium]|nr:hypothetical protein [Bacteroidota bacterium]
MKLKRCEAPGIFIEFDITDFYKVRSTVILIFRCYAAYRMIGEYFIYKYYAAAQLNTDDLVSAGITDRIIRNKITR